MKSRGFTLIELLIVVAIIAILAAIAVPNFLEAQTRATVSRTKADMRSVTTALVTYQIDNNKYPIDGSGASDGQAYWYVPGGPTAGTKAGGVTSPVAYLTSVKLVDPFRKAADGAAAKNLDVPDSQYFEPIDYCRYRYTNFPYTYVDSRAAPGLPQYVGAYGVAYGAYRISSSGPDKTAGPSSPNKVKGSNPAISQYIVYDSTNGTVSRGDILRSEKYGEQVLVPEA